VTDVLGIYANSQFLADDFAANGWLTVIPDLFEGNPVTLDEFNSGIDLRSRLANYTAKTDPIIDKTIKYLRETLGIKKIGAAGYCYGAKVNSTYD
jgi:dienelactone hydrolase